ncbi:MAG: ABC transporter permease [Lachnospiraceae bacterium]|nr:ABC transporter permease [Lachnospiraceae bacterium]
MEKIKRILSKIKYYRVICLLVTIVFLIVGIIMKIIVGIGADKYSDQTVSKRWDKKGDHAQISYFLKETAGFGRNDIIGLEYELNAKLDYNSIEAASEESRRFIDCYMAKSTIALESERNIVDVDCMAIGGDFFVFHPVKMITGSYFSGNDLMQDGIILDEMTAWQLFGSNDIVGQKVLYGDRVLFVKGVYERKDNKLFNYARGDKPEIFVPFDLLNSEENPLSITCFEICMPNPIDNFATKLCSEIVDLDSHDFESVENSTRYSVANLWRVYKSRKYRSMQNHDIIYPYWEKIARYEEDLLAPKAVIMVVSFVVSGTVFISLVLYELTKLTKLRKKNDD